MRGERKNMETIKEGKIIRIGFPLSPHLLIKDKNDNGMNRNLSMTVHDVIRNVCHTESSSTNSNTNDDALSMQSTTNCVDACVASVVQSMSNDRLTSTNGHHFDETMIDEEIDNHSTPYDQTEPPPKLIAMIKNQNQNNNFDQYRYRKRRKRRRLTMRTQRNRYPMKSNGAPKSANRNKINGFKISSPRNGSFKKNDQLLRQDDGDDHLDTQIHHSVFSPDRCRLMKISKERKKNIHVVDDGETKSNNFFCIPKSCWHSYLNDKLLPNIANFKNTHLDQVGSWSIERVAEFIRSLPACPPTVADKFLDEQIDGEAFLLMTQDDIVKLMNIRLGPAVKIHNAIMFLKHQRLNGF